jgi:hypothetical protein
MHMLTLHPQSSTGSITKIQANIEPITGGCRATFVAIGQIDAMRVPAIEADRGRHDNLWKTTCFEIFWQPEDQTRYREFNLSPSTRWACYDFDDFRVGMRNAPANVEIVVMVSDTELRVTATILSDLPVPARVALNAIIEDGDGVNRFWALDFPDGAPEFHSPVCRQLALGR